MNETNETNDGPIRMVIPAISLVSFISFKVSGKAKNSQRARGCDVAILANAIGVPSETFAHQCSEQGERADRVTLSRPRSSSRARTGSTRHLGTISCADRWDAAGRCS